MAATLESVSDEIGQTFVNRQQPFAMQSSTQLCSAKKDIVYVPSQNETIIPSMSIPSVHNLKSSSRMEDISCQGSLEAKNNGMMPAAHHTEHLSPSTKPAQNLRDADPAYGLYDKHLPPKWTKLGAFLSAFHINRKCRPNVGDPDISPGVPRQGFSDAESCSSALQANYPWRHKGRRRIQRLSYVLMVYVAGVLALMAVRVGNSHPWNQREDPVLELVEPQEGSQGFMPHDSGLRHKRDVRVEYITVAENSSSHHEAEHLNCTPRSVSNFPKNFLNFHDTQNGGFILNILIAMYMFAALAIVCDDYFVPALEHICEDLGLQADVAGATFMAAGSSAPEFMTSVVGVFFAQSDVGVGTIVGSAVFNILFIIGICGVFAGMVVELTWYPLVRDTLYYLISVLTLVLIIKDQQVMWYEATIMVVLYMLYIVLMYFNRFLESSSIAWVQRLAARLERQPLVAKPPETHIIPEEMKRARAHSRISNTSMSLSMSREYEKPAHPIEQSVPEEQETSIREDGDLPPTPSNTSSKNGELMTVSEFESVWTFPDSTFQRVLYILTSPIKAVFFVTIPDSRRPGIWAKLYLVSFVMSVAWISGLTYIMVWMVTVAGDALDIPDTVMGLTILAAGTSVPDCLASVFVARDGYGDMAVSNSLGSNVFDILLCLGVPWLIESAIKHGESVVITSEGLTYSALTLLGTVVFLFASMAINKWKLNKSYGLVCLVAYLLVITISCLYELNVFGDFNPPSCPR